MFDDKEVVLNKSVAKITLNSDYPGMAAMALGAFDFDSRIEYYAPDASDGQVACAIDLEALRNDDSLCFSLDYEQGEQSILDMTLNLPLSQDFVINTVDEALDAVDEDGSSVGDLNCPGADDPCLFKPGVFSCHKCTLE